LSAIIGSTRRILLRALLVTIFLPAPLWQWTVDETRIIEPFNSVVIYLTDVAGLAFVGATAAWLVVEGRSFRWGDRRITGIIFALVALNTLSLAWASVPALALTTAMHWGLVAAVYLCVVNSTEDFIDLAPAICWLVAAESVVGMLQLLSDSTLVNRWLLGWPDELYGLKWGSSVENADGMRLLRAYGTVAHPNHLGGYAAIAILILIGASLSGQTGLSRMHWRLSLGLGVWLLLLTFSRGAWLAFGLAFVYLLLATRRRAYRYLPLIGELVGITLLFLSIFWPWVIQRIQTSSVRVERVSIQDRTDLLSTAWKLIESHPLTGTGGGNYMRGVLQLPDAPGTPIPVHNPVLMAAGELGIGGGVLVLAVWAVIVHAAWFRRHSAVAATAHGVMLAVIVANAFDLYIWGLASGRLLLGLLLGLWVNSQCQAKNETQQIQILGSEARLRAASGRTWGC